MNLQQQINALQNDLKLNNRNKVTLQQVTVNWKCKQFNTLKYCWTHGTCAYNGHKDTATFATKMGGSSDFFHKSEWLIVSDKLKCHNMANNYNQHYKIFHNTEILLYLTTNMHL